MVIKDQADNDRSNYVKPGCWPHSMRAVKKLCSGASFAIRELRKSEDPFHHICWIDSYHGKWKGSSSPKIKAWHARSQCKAKCGREVCTFCFCDWSLMLCPSCHGEHVKSINMVEKWNEVSDYLIFYALHLVF